MGQTGFGQTGFGQTGFAQTGLGNNFNGEIDLGNNLNSQTTPRLQTTTPDPATLGCGTLPDSCPNTQYRSYDGTCNNLQNPLWGTPNTRYNRLLPPNYGDGEYLLLIKIPQH